MSATRLLTLLAAAVIVVAACSSSYASPAAVGGGASVGTGVTIGTASSPDFGTVLTGPNGLTLYTHAGDTATSSTCTGDCATEWPPLAATGQPTAGPGVTGQLGTATRPDGTKQVTYAGLPLYYWEGDKKAGDVTGNGIDDFAVATVGGTGAAPNPAAGSPAPNTPGTYGY